MAITVSTAESKKELFRVFRNRLHAFKHVEGYPIVDDPCSGMEIDRYDCLARTLQFIARKKTGIVGFVRLVSQGERANEQDIPLDDRFVIDFDSAGSRYKGQKRGEVGRLFVEASSRGEGVASNLCRVMCKESLKRGVTVWQSAASMDTDDEREANDIYLQLDRRGYVRRDVRVKMKAAERPTRSSRPFFKTPFERHSAQLGMARRVPAAVIADASLGAVFVGRPYFEAEIGRYAMPFFAYVPDVLARFRR
ncbi:GNAT family N-acetyltransferase [Polyangium mundeleinium]|uniref:GNAT family N-acetyltransferase n=1 Tax=Polyangium mundeleinium TaxID=2995306 RepID=A0ABT5EN40_9BACT|nr:GNAT family N-acetyltransferase [Polyangium mundeleinium]MDC0743221.1 GNAT family N-acetyltransferase [Polyangium mundeleinium]